MNKMMTEARQSLGTFFRDTGGETENWPRIAPATERFRAIDLSCRACDACGAGAGYWAWIPGGGLRSAPFSTPNLRFASTRNFTIIRTSTPVIWRRSAQCGELDNQMEEPENSMQKECWLASFSTFNLRSCTR